MKKLSFETQLFLFLFFPFFSFLLAGASPRLPRRSLRSGRWRLPLALGGTTFAGAAVVVLVLSTRAKSS